MDNGVIKECFQAKWNCTLHLIHYSLSLKNLIVRASLLVLIGEVFGESREGIRREIRKK